MKYIRLISLYIVLVFSAVVMTSCGGGGSGSTPSTRVEVFDGPAVGCTVATEDATATEVGSTEPGIYRFNVILDEGTVVTATGCTDTDTSALLPNLAGVAQTGGVIVSPITTLIVNAAELSLRARTGDIANRTISATVLDQITNQIVASLGIAGYDPLDPATANYVEAAKADTSGTSAAATVMKSALAVSTLLKAVEVSAGENAEDAVTAVAKAFADASNPVDLTSTTEVQNLLTEAAATTNSTLASAINTASAAVSESVAAISGATGPISIAIAATETVAGVLNTAQPEILADTTIISNLNTAVQQTIEEITTAAAPDCVLGTGVLGNCKI